MQHIVIASDSFKGTLASEEICEIFKDVLEKFPKFRATYLPIGDGGENSLVAISENIHGRYLSVKTSDPYFNKINVKYYLDAQNNAYIETATSAGLHLSDKLDPSLATTYGVGEQIKDAIKRGAKTIYIFLGGSATNDAGCGLFSALGTKFYNQNNEVFIPTGGTLKNITHINNEKTKNLLKNIKVIGLVDVQNKLYGPDGAASVYAPQKGADPQMVKQLDDGLKHFAKIAKKVLEKDIRKLKGGGAAGGLGAGIVAFSDGSLQPGIETILDLVKFDALISDADYVITGEGKLDAQSFYGKVISGVAKRAARQNKDVIIIAGTSEITLKKAQKKYSVIKAVYETNALKLPFHEFKKNAVNMYLDTAKIVLNAIALKTINS